jgi:hypothetical protein
MHTNKVIPMMDIIELNGAKTLNENQEAFKVNS